MSTDHTFNQTLKRMLNTPSNSRPPKMELTGLLTPQLKWIDGQYCRFKLVTDTNEYSLQIDDALAPAAKKACWEEVTVRGYLNPESQVFLVEKIMLSKRHERLRAPLVFDLYNDLSFVNRMIHQLGWIEPASDCLAC